MRHDPERNAASYLGGEMSRRRRRAFEAHIIDCEDCWQEVHTGRAGRAVAESGRELAPQLLRERVRAAVETLETRRHRWRWLGAGGGLALALVAVLALISGGDDQPRVIAAVVADFQEGSGSGVPTSPSLPRRAGDLHLTDVRTFALEGFDVVVHAYEDPAGRRVAVYQAEEPFPVADGADHIDGGNHWTAQVDGAVLWCTDEPIPSLVVADSVAQQVEIIDLMRDRRGTS